MADRYWVGGSGTWDTTSTTNWSATSGGAGGASVPTVADSVFFNQPGTYTVTMTGALNCLDLTVSAGVVTLAQGTSPTLTIAGSLSLVAGTVWNMTGTTTFTSATTGRTITTNGTSIASTIQFNNATGGWTLGSALTSTATGNLTLTAGSFNTGNFNVTLTAGGFNSNNSNVRSLILGSSTFTYAGNFNILTTTNLTFNAGTSTLIGTLNGLTFNGGNLTYNNIRFNTGVPGSITLNGNNTLNTLQISSPSTGVLALILGGNNTINGTFSTTGTNGIQRIWIRSDTYGIQRSLFINSAPSISDVDFRDIIVQGTAAPISGTRIGDRGQNVGITFSAPKTVYWNLAGTQNWSSNGWALTSTGTPNLNNFPLPQDTAVFTNAGAAGTITLDSSITYAPTVDMSSRTTAMTLNISNAYDVYGSWTNGSGVTISGTARLTFAGQANKVFTPAGRIMQSGITISSIGGSLTLGGAHNFSGTSADFSLEAGIFDTAGYSCRIRRFFTNNANFYRALYLRNSTFTTANGQSPLIFAGSNFEFFPGTSTVVIESGNGSLGPHINAPGYTFYDVSVNLSFNVRDVQPTYPFYMSGCTIRNLTFNTLSPTDGVAEIRLDGNVNVTGTLTVPTNTVTRRILFRSTNIGTQRTLTVNSWVGTQNLDFMDINIQGTASPLSGTSFGDCGRNNNITFTTPKTVYWNLAGTQNWSAAAWALTSGGTPSINNFPLPQDTIVFDDAGAAGTITINGYYNIGNINGSSRTTAITIAHTTGTMIPKFLGDFIISSAFTFSHTTPQFRFCSNTLKTLSLNGATLPMPIEIQSPINGGLILGSAFTCTQPVYHFGGIFDCNIYNFTASNFQAQQSTDGIVFSKQLLMGSGLWTITGNDLFNPYNSTFAVDSGTITNFSAADIIFTSTSTAGRGIGLGTNYYWKKVTIAGNGTRTNSLGAGNFTSCFIEELASTTSVAHTISLGGNSVWYIGKWSVSGTPGNVVTISRGGIGGSIFIVGPAVTGVDYLSFTGSMSLDGNSIGEFYAGANSTNPGAGTGITFTAAPTPRTLYWVGGTGNWGDTARWSLSSGGTGGQAIPTTQDDVIFDSASNATAYTATINVEARCKSLTIAGPASGNVTLAGTSRLSVMTGLTFPSTGFTRTWSGSLRLSGYNTNNTINTNGVNIPGNVDIFGFNSNWTLGSAITFNGTISITTGGFNTGNYALTYFDFTSNNLLKRSISLGSSAILSTSSTLFNFDNAMYLTFDCGTASITNNSATPVLRAARTTGLPLTFTNITYTNTSLATITYDGNITANNITVTGRTTTGVANFILNGNLTINNNLNITAGSDATCRTFVRSGTIGTQRTITCNTLSSLTDVDFRDIAFAGNCISGGNITGTRLGDCKGNTNITFPAGKTVYYTSTSGGNWGSSNWSLSSDGTGSSAINFPLAQDTAIFTATLPSSGQTITLNSTFNIGTLNFSNRTSNLLTFSNSQVTNIVGDFIAGTGVTFSGAASLVFCGRTTQFLTNNGRTYPFSIELNSPGGSLTLVDSYITSLGNTNAILITSGSFSDGGYNVSLTATNSGVNMSNGLLSRSVTVNGTWTLNGGNPWSAGTPASNFTVTGNGTINLTNPSSKTFSGAGQQHSGITLNNGGAGTLSITGDNAFANITNTQASTSATIIALGATSQRVGNFTASGQAGRVLTITGNTSTLIYTGGGILRNLDYLNLQGRVYDSNGKYRETWYAGNNSVNSGILGWELSAAPGGEASNSNFFLLFA